MRFARPNRASRRLALAAALLVPAAAAAQIPDEFRNLKILPKDIPKRELVEIMREFSAALGERCTTCHPGPVPGSLEGVDFASDELEAKRVTRAMMKMVAEINGKLMPQSGLESPAEVRCVTCHRGVEHPLTLDVVMLSTVEKRGIAAAVERYRKLRERYYGSGAYDFGPQSLSSAARVLAGERGDLDGALALAQLNTEHNPRSADAYVVLAQLQAAKGDPGAAAGSLELALRIDPEHEEARRMLERVRPGE